MRNYVLNPYQVVKDLRTGYEVGNPTSVFDGDLDGFLEAGIRWRRGRRAADGELAEAAPTPRRATAARPTAGAVDQVLAGAGPDTEQVSQASPKSPR